MAQHWVPQHVLRGFSADGKTVWQYDKTGSVLPVKVGIKNACARNDAFAEPVEQLMSTIEHRGSSAIKAFRRMAQPVLIDPVAKRIAAVYLNMFLWKRSPATRDSQVAETDEAVLLACARDGVRDHGLPSDLVRDVMPIAVAKAAADVNGLMAEHWSSNAFQRWLFHSMSWAVLRCAEPVATIPDQGLARLGSRGPLDPKAEFYFPLSSKRVLVMSWNGGPPNTVQLVKASPAHVRRINKLGFRQAGRFVYGEEYSERLAAAVQKSSRHLPTPRPLQLAGGLNPKVPELSNLRAWHEKLGLDDPDRHWCMAPGAGERCRHSWRRAPFELPVVSDEPEITMAVDVCEWCGGLQKRHRTGLVEFDDMELCRTLTRPPSKNWWQHFDVTHAGNRIEARGAIPLYRLAEEGR